LVRTCILKKIGELLKLLLSLLEIVRIGWLSLPLVLSLSLHWLVLFIRQLKDAIVQVIVRRSSSESLASSHVASFLSLAPKTFDIRCNKNHSI
jgi:hypothetical protein